MMLRKTSLFLLLLFLLCTTTCQRQESPHAGVTDDAGCKLHLPTRPERIVSLLPSLTNSVIALGAQDRLVGVTRWCKPTKDLPLVGDILRPDMERIVSLRPDLILASMEGSNQAHMEKLRSVGLPVYVFGEVEDFKTMKSQLKRLGDLLGIPSRAEELVTRSQAQVDAVRRRLAHAPGRRVFFQLGDRPLVSCGSQTYLHEMITLAGGINIASGLSARYPRISAEQVLLADPEIIVAIDMTGSPMAVREKWGGVSQLSAARDGKIFAIESDAVCHPTPFEFAHSCETLARLIHPERFRP
jgi:iron complex transport system substrate-binding protein